jgi:hypothetical protein
MLFGNRRPRMVPARRHAHDRFRPRCERLETRRVLQGNTYNLLAVGSPANPAIASNPNGVAFGGDTAGQGAGYSVADVGDVNGTGYDTLVIGAPTVNNPPSSIGSGAGSAVYMVFTSQTVGVSSVTNWIGTNSNNVFNYTPNDRVGDLGQLTTPTTPAQTNPISGTALDFPFPFIKFENTVSLNSDLGASVAGVRLPNGQGAVILGAPGALDANGANPGTGRVYLIYGSFNNFIGQTINLDDPNFATDFSGLNLVTFVSSATAGQLGAAVAGGSNIFGDGSTDVIMGAPLATVAPSTSTNPVPANTGVVYAMSLGVIPSGTATVNVTTGIGQSGSQSAQFAGVASGDHAGFSVADGGNVNGASGNVDDLLIGAPDAAASDGQAYLVYGGSNLANSATTVNSVRYIPLSTVGTTAIPGAIFTGPAGGDETGFSVSSAGDFNGAVNGTTNIADIMIGSPGFGTASNSTTDQGAVTLFYGAPSTSSAYLTGTISLANIPAAIQSVSFTGANEGDMAGYALSLVGAINVGQPDPILIGAPGFNGDTGSAYLIPGRAGFTGVFSLASPTAAPLEADQFLASAGSTNQPNFFGASVSSRVQDTADTMDTDNFADFIIGAPGYDVDGSTTRLLAGGAFAVEGGLITLAIPAVNSVTVPIGVGTANPPFVISATTPANLQIFVFGSTATTPDFMPVTDINVATVKVNGVAFPNATIEQDPDANNYNPDGIPDAIITINPRSALNLPSGTTTVTITGQTLATSPLPNFTWTGTATVSVTGGSSTPVISAVVGPPSGPVTFTTLVTPFGSTQYTPSITALSLYNYQPIPLQVALAQYTIPQGFRQRIYSFNHPGKTIGPYLTNRGQNQGRAGGINTLSFKVYNRSRFHAQKVYTWKHKAPKSGLVDGIIPAQAKTQTFDDNLVQAGAAGSTAPQIQKL